MTDGSTTQVTETRQTLTIGQYERRLINRAVNGDEKARIEWRELIGIARSKP